jgi:hypothetical protein
VKLKQFRLEQHQKRIQYFVINLTKKGQDLYNENYKRLLEERKRSK